MAAKSSPKPAPKSSSKTAPKTAVKAAAKPAAKPKPTAARKPTTAKSTAKTPAKTSTVKPPLSVVKDGATATPGLELKKRELLDQVVKRTDVKKKFAKPVLEAMLDVMGEALAEERPLNLQPMGRVMPKRTKEAGTNRVITARIRQSKTAAKDKSNAAADMQNPPVAKPAE